MPDKNNLPENTDNGMKVELYVKDNAKTAQQGETTIDLMGIVRFMKLKTRIFAFFMAICVILGAAIPLAIYQFTAEKASAVAVVTFKYAGAADGRAPDGSTLDVTEVKSSYVIQNALDNAVLSEAVSVSDIAGNISVQGVLTEETMSQLEILQSLSDNTSTASQYYEMLSTFEMKYCNRYIITLNNTFGKAKVTLPESELRILLNAIVTAYNEYFFEKYAMQSLPDNELDAISLDSLDYVEQVEYLGDVLDTLLKYCSAKAAAFPTYRSQTDGLSFNDMASSVSATIDINVNAINSKIFTNHVAKDYEKLLTTYDYYIREKQLDLQVAEDSLASVKKMIEEYKNEQLVIMSQDSKTSESSSQSASLTTEYYNGLIIKQMNLSEQIAEINNKIAEYSNIVDKFSNQATYSDTTEVEDDIEALYNDCTDLYNLIYGHTEELFSTSYFNNTYISSIITMDEGSRLSDCAKNIGVGAAVGLVIGLVVWCGDGLIAELKKNDKDAPDASV